MHVINPLTGRKRLVRRGDVFDCTDSRRLGLRIVVLKVFTDAVGYRRVKVKNDLGRTYTLFADRLNPHSHWKFIGISHGLSAMENPDVRATA